jgi:uncharacterized protein YbjT (DUF2867 family)
MSVKKTILVTGVTGQQGNAAARQLLKKGFSVKGLVRDKNKDTARAIEKLGVQLVEGNLENKDSLKRALDGIDGVFSVTAAALAVPKEQEVEQGINIAELSKQAGVNHFVFTSSLGASQPTGVPFLESKREIEKHIRESGLPYTILQPTAFMENFKNMWLQGDRIYAPFNPNLELMMISVRDIGEFASIAFERPKEFLGKTLPLAVDIQPLSQIAKSFSRVLGRRIHFEPQPIEEVKRFSEPLARMYERYNQGAAFAPIGQADLEMLRKINPHFWTLEEWIKHTYETHASTPA